MATEHNHESKMQEKISHSIESGEIKMRPRWQFTAKEALTLGLGILIGMVLLYLASFVEYAEHVLLPLALAVAFIILFEAYLRRHSVAYRRPLIVTLAVTVVIVALLSFFLMRIRAHERFHRFVHMRGVPVFDPFYQHFGPPMPPMPIFMR